MFRLTKAVNNRTNRRQPIDIGFTSMYHVVLADDQAKLLSLMLMSNIRHTSPAQENANLSTISCHTSCQYQIIHISLSISNNSRLSKQSTLDVAEKSLTKKQKIKHAASKGAFPGAASGRYIQGNIVLEKKWIRGIRYKWQEFERARLEFEGR